MEFFRFFYLLYLAWWLSAEGLLHFSYFLFILCVKTIFSQNSLLFVLSNALNFRLFGYVCEKLWQFEVKWVWIVCCEIGIAVACVAQHVVDCTQVLQALDVNILSSL